MSDIELQASLRRASARLLIPVLVFFPMIFNPIIVGFYDPTKSEADLLAFREEHWLAIRLLFTGIGVSFVVMGLALRTWGRQLASLSPGRSTALAGAAGWAAVAGGVLSLMAYGSVWLWTPAELAEFLDSAVGTMVFVVAWIPLSGAFVLLGILTFQLRSPRWLGVVLPLIAVLPFATLLPLWFFVGAVVAGITGLIRYRTGSNTGVTAAA